MMMDGEIIILVGMALTLSGKFCRWEVFWSGLSNAFVGDEAWASWKASLRCNRATGLRWWKWWLLGNSWRWPGEWNVLPSNLSIVRRAQRSGVPPYRLEYVQQLSFNWRIVQCAKKRQTRSSLPQLWCSVRIKIRGSPLRASFKTNFNCVIIDVKNSCSFINMISRSI